MNGPTVSAGKPAPTPSAAGGPALRGRTELRVERAAMLLRLLRWERDGRWIRDATFIGMVVLVDLLLLYTVARGDHTLTGLEPGFVVAATLGVVSLACAGAVARLEYLCMQFLRGAEGVAAVAPLIRLLDADDARVYRMAARMVARMLPKLSDDSLGAMSDEDRNILVRELETTNPNSQPALLEAALNALTRLRDSRACAAARSLLVGPPSSRREQRVRRAARLYLRVALQPVPDEGGPPAGGEGQ